ncbi:hypothetical protein BH18ACI5_BH18ACI5_22800 [soil metagenome]
MQTWVAGFKMYRTIALIMTRCGCVMFVRGDAVMVLGMIVIGVGVDVQRRELAGGRGHNQSKQNSCEAIHHHECM